MGQSYIARGASSGNFKSKLKNLNNLHTGLKIVKTSLFVVKIKSKKVKQQMKKIHSPAVQTDDRRL